MSTPSWPQFARIPFDSTVAAVVRALGVEIPPEGRPRSFMGPAGFIAHHTSDGRWLVRDGRAARYVDDGPDEVLRAARLTVGTPSGDALRQWLSWWGGSPRSGRCPMPDHLIIDASRQPNQIRCLYCGFAEDLRLPMAIPELVALERRINAEHRGCKPQRAGEVRS